MLLTKKIKVSALALVVFAVTTIVLLSGSTANANSSENLRLTRQGNDVKVQIVNDPYYDYDTYDYYEVIRKTPSGGGIYYVASQDDMPKGGIPEVLDTPPDINASYIYEVHGTKKMENECDPADPNCDTNGGGEYDYNRVVTIGTRTLPAQTPPRTCTTYFNIGLDTELASSSSHDISDEFTVQATGANGVTYTGLYVGAANTNYQYRFSIPPDDWNQDSDEMQFEALINSNLPQFRYEGMQGATGNSDMFTVEYCPDTQRAFYADIGTWVQHLLYFNDNSNSDHEPASINILFDYPKDDRPQPIYSTSIYSQEITTDRSFVYDQIAGSFNKNAPYAYAWPGYYKLEVDDGASATAIVYDPEGNNIRTYNSPTDVRANPGDRVLWRITTPEVQQTVTGEIRANFRACDANGNNCTNANFNEEIDIMAQNGTNIGTLNINNTSTGQVALNANETVSIAVSDDNSDTSLFRVDINGVIFNDPNITCYANAISADSKCGTAGEYGVIDSVKSFANNIWNSITGKSDQSTFVTLMEITAADLIANGGSITVTPEYRYAPEDPDFSISLNPTSRTFTASGQTQCFAVVVTPQNGFDKNRVTLTAGSVDPSFSYTKTDVMLSENGNTYDNGEVCFTLNNDRADFSDVVSINGSASGVRRTNPNTGAVTYETVTRSRGATLTLDNTMSATIQARQPGGQWQNNDFAFTSNSRNVEIRAINVRGFEGSCTDVMFGRNGQIFDATVVPSHNGTTSTVSTSNAAHDQSYNYTVTCDGGPALDTISIRINSVVPDPTGDIRAKGDDGIWHNADSTITQNSNSLTLGGTNIGSCSDQLFFADEAQTIYEPDGGYDDYTNPQVTVSLPFDIAMTYSLYCGQEELDAIRITLREVSQPPSDPSGNLEVKKRDNTWDNSSPSTVYNGQQQVTLRTTNVQDCPANRVNYYRGGTYVTNSSNSSNNYEVIISQSYNSTETYHARCDATDVNFSSHTVTLREPTYTMSITPSSLSFNSNGQQQCLTVNVTPVGGYVWSFDLTASVPSGFGISYPDGQLYAASTYNSGGGKRVCYTNNSASNSNYSSTVTLTPRYAGSTSRHRTASLSVNAETPPNGNLQYKTTEGNWRSGSATVSSDTEMIYLRTPDLQHCPSGPTYKADGVDLAGSSLNHQFGTTIEYSLYCGAQLLDNATITLERLTPLEASGTLQIEHPTSGWTDSPSPWNASATTFNIRTANVQNCSQSLYYKRQGNSTTLATRSPSSSEASLANPTHDTAYTYTVQCGSSGSVFDTILVTINQLASPTGNLEVQQYDGSWDNSSPSTVYNGQQQVTLRTTNVQDCPANRVNYYRGGTYVTNSSGSSNNYEVTVSHSHGATNTYHARCHGHSTNMSSHQVTLQEPDYSASFSPTNLNFTAVGQKQCVDVVVAPHNGYSESLILSSSMTPAFVGTVFDNGLYYRANEYNAGVTKTICFTLDSDPPSNDTYTVAVHTSEYSPTENTKSRSVNLNVNITPDPTGTIQAQDTNNNSWHSSSLTFESNSRNFNLRSVSVANCSDNLVYKRSGSGESKTTGPASGGTGPTVGFTVPAFGQTYIYTVHCGSDIDSLSQVNVRINEANSSVDTDQHVYSQTTSGAAIQSSWNATVTIDSSNTAVNGSNQTMNSRVITANDPDVGTTSFTLNDVTPPNGYIFDSVQVYSSPSGRGSCGSPSSRTTTTLGDSLSWTGKCNLTAFVKYAPNPVTDYIITTIIEDINRDPVVADWRNTVRVGNETVTNRRINNNSSNFITLSVPENDPDISEYSIDTLTFPDNYVFGPSSSVRVGNPADGCAYRTSNNPSASFSWSNKCDLVATVTLEKAPNYEISIDPEITVIAGVTGDQCTTLTVQTDENTAGTVTVDFNFDLNNSDTNAVSVNYDRSFAVTSSNTYQKPICFEIDERIGRGSYGYRINTSSDIVGGDGGTVEHNVSGTLEVKNIPDGSVTEN